MIELIGITKKGKEKIKTHGSLFKFIKEDFVEFSNGLHILLESNKNGSRRWIKKSQDKDFEIKEIL